MSYVNRELSHQCWVSEQSLVHHCLQVTVILYAIKMEILLPPGLMCLQCRSLQVPAEANMSASLQVIQTSTG